MKNFVLNCILYIARLELNIIYFFMKLFPIQKNKITMLSRQSDEINMDFNMLLEEINNRDKNIKVKILCKKIPKCFIKKIGYCFFILKSLYHIATSRVCIVDGYIIPISTLKHKKKLIIIQIWHAMGAIKQFGRQVLDKNEGSKRTVANIMRMHANYTYVTCVSSEARKTFAKAFQTDIDKILTLGMPRIDYLLGKDNKINDRVEELLINYPLLKEKKTILYVPTFRKDKYVHIYDVINAVDEEQFNLIIRLHPLDETKIDSKYTISRKYKTYELIKVADYIITDYSAVAFEACVLDKPVFFYLYDIEEYKENRGLNIDLKKEMPASTFSNINNIIDIIMDNKYQYGELRQFKERYIETADTNNTERIVDFVIDLMEE